MVQGLYIVTLLSSALGALVFVLGFLGAKSAPQEASAAAAAIALAVIPYVFARCVQLVKESKLSEKKASLLEDISIKLDRTRP